MTGSFLLTRCFVGIASLLPVSEAPRLEADTVLVNGNIVTVDEEFTLAEAVAIRDGIFARVGTSDDVLGLRGPLTRVIDLQGKTVVPGFIDGHAHMDREGLKFLHPTLTGARSISDVLEIVRREVEASAPGAWVVTMPLGDYPLYLGAEAPEFLAEGRFPNRWDLDRVAPNNPVYIKAGWFYWRGRSPLVSIANTKALELAGIDRDTIPPHESIEIVREVTTGEPTGVFLEHADVGAVEFTLMKVVPRFSHAERVHALAVGMKRYNAAGTTGVYEGHGVADSTIRAYEELRQRGELTVRSYLVRSPSWDSSPSASLFDFLNDSSFRTDRDTMLTISGVLAEVGVSALAELRRRERPYTGWSGQSVDGSLPIERGTFEELAHAAARAGVRANMIWFDPGVLARQLEALERVNEKVPIASKRWVVQHLTFVTGEQQDRIKKLGLVVTVQPNGHIWKSGAGLTAKAKADELDTFVPLASFVDKDIPFVLSTDNKRIEPVTALWSAVTRKERRTGKAIAPRQRLSREDALRAMTLQGAYLSFDEHSRGSIEPGKLADLAVLSDNILNCDDDAIEKLSVLLTMVGGEIVHLELQ